MPVEMDDLREVRPQEGSVREYATANDRVAAIASFADQSLGDRRRIVLEVRSEEHTSELQSLMRISYAVFCLKKKKITTRQQTETKRGTYTQRTTANPIRTY